MLGLTDLVKAMIRADQKCLWERGAHDFPLLSFTAFGKERLEVAEFLLDSGADPNPNPSGQPLLHVAAAKGHLDLAKLFLDRGAEVNAASKFRGRSETALAVALRSKQAKMAELLRERGGRA